MPEAKAKKKVVNELPFEKAAAEEVIPLLQSGVSWKARLQCWTPGRGHSLTSRIVKVHEGLVRIVISVAKEGPEGAAFERGVTAGFFEEVLFSLHLPTDVVFFKGEFIPIGPGAFSVRVKDALYKVQRREALRLPVPGNPSVRLVLPDGGVRAAELLNVSEGGVGLIFRDKPSFEVVSKIKENFTIEFNAFKIAVRATVEVKHSTEVGSAMVRKSFRLGLSFSDLDPRLRTELSQLVLEESSKYLGRF
jgi:hypothetical protein